MDIDINDMKINENDLIDITQVLDYPKLPLVPRIEYFLYKYLELKLVYKTNINIDPDINTIATMRREINKLDSPNFMKSYFGNSIYDEYIDGIRLTDFSKTLSLGEFLVLYRRIIQLLAYAYDKICFIHGNLKASNIIIRNSEPVFISYNSTYVKDIYDGFKNIPIDKKIAYSIYILFSHSFWSEDIESFCHKVKESLFVGPNSIENLDSSITYSKFMKIFSSIDLTTI